ncbi:MAG: TetR/AcrR family transcriptional regulator [Pseudomonadota bacterium]
MPRSSQTTKAQILAAAKERFSTLGYDGASTRDIADASGCAQSLLLYHFSSKELLWQAMMDDLFSKARSAVAPHLVASTEPAMAQLMAGVRGFVAFCAADADLHRLMVQEGRADTGRLKWLVETHLRATHDQITALIAQAQADGAARPGHPTLIYYAIISLAATIFSLSPEIDRLAPDMGLDRAAEVVAMIENFLAD